MKYKECDTCNNSFPDFNIEDNECPRCCGFTVEELSKDLIDIYDNIDEKVYDLANDPYPQRLYPEAEMN